MLSKIVDNYSDDELSQVIQYHCEYLWKNDVRNESFDDYEHERKICDAFIKAWKIAILRDKIDSLVHLSDIEKAEIMDNSEEEMKLKKEKFDKDLEILKWLWQELWFEIQVNNTKEQTDKPKE